ncbi:hypothetical protein QFZ71_002410 [Streptomyces sp. V2I9]|nr:hypothetical protein [Streptomyces sp. V2I9]
MTGSKVTRAFLNSLRTTSWKSPIMIARLNFAYSCAQKRSLRYAAICGVSATNTARSRSTSPWLCGSFCAWPMWKSASSLPMFREPECSINQTDPVSSRQNSIK